MSLSVGSNPKFSLIHVSAGPPCDRSKNPSRLPATHPALELSSNPPSTDSNNPFASSTYEKFSIDVFFGYKIQPDLTSNDAASPDFRLACRRTDEVSALDDFVSAGSRRFSARISSDKPVSWLSQFISDVLTKLDMHFSLDGNVHWNDFSGSRDQCVRLETRDDLILKILGVPQRVTKEGNHRSVAVTIERTMFLAEHEYRALIPAWEAVTSIKYTVGLLVLREAYGGCIGPFDSSEWSSLFDEIRTATIPVIFWKGILELVVFSGLNRSRKLHLRTELLAALWDMAAIVTELESPGQHLPRPKPAAATAVEDLPKDIVTATDDSRICVICMEQLTIGSEFTLMPCLHEYHSTCIERWLLERSNVCPLCRCQLPTAE